MDPQRRRIRLADGRDLDVFVGGADSDRGFLMVNGTPAGVMAQAGDVDLVARHGLRYVTFGRPGYGDSTRQPGRSVADITRDVRGLAGVLGLTRIYIIGWSGGGPHALACAALLPDLVAGVATIASPAPYGADGLDWLDGMAPENLDEFDATLVGPAALEAFLDAVAGDLATTTGADVGAWFGELVSDVDRATLTGGFADYIAASCRDAVRNGIWGWADDDLAFVRDWGFDLDSITVPVTVWQGSEDRMVPFGHGRWLADHVPGARARLLGGEGHLSLVVSSFGRIVDELVGDGASG